MTQPKRYVLAFTLSLILATPVVRAEYPTPYGGEPARCENDPTPVEQPSLAHAEPLCIHRAQYPDKPEGPGNPVRTYINCRYRCVGFNVECKAGCEIKGDVPTATARATCRSVAKASLLELNLNNDTFRIQKEAETPEECHIERRGEKAKMAAYCLTHNINEPAYLRECRRVANEFSRTCNKTVIPNACHD